MKSFLLAGLLLIVSAFSLQAQNALPDPHNDAAWQSLESLRAWQLDQYNREVNYERSCTSYPEYQCNPSTSDTKGNPEVAKGTSTKKAGPTSAVRSSRTSNLTPISAATADSK